MSETQNADTIVSEAPTQETITPPRRAPAQESIAPPRRRFLRGATLGAAGAAAAGLLAACSKEPEPAPEKKDEPAKSSEAPAAPAAAVKPSTVVFKMQG